MALLVFPGRPAANALLWWCLTKDGAAPTVSVSPGGGTVRRHRLDEIEIDEGGRRAVIWVIAVGGLAAGTRYALEVSTLPDTRAMSSSRTLPAADDAETPLELALGSCYSLATDDSLAASYPPPTSGEERIGLRFLCGDNIYMDVDPEAIPFKFVNRKPKPLHRYFRQWRDTRHAAFLSKSPTILVADDHDYWNNFPHAVSIFSWTWFGRKRLAERMDRAFSLFQAAMNLDPALLANAGDPDWDRLLGSDARSFSLQAGVTPIFVLDTRTRRSRYAVRDQRLMEPKWLDDVTRWLEDLRRPGLLVVGQPLIARPSAFPRILPRWLRINIDLRPADYSEDYARLCEALFTKARHDVLILTGDIHKSRLYRATSGNGSNRVHELTSSPLSLYSRKKISWGFRTLVHQGTRQSYDSSKRKIRWKGGGSADWSPSDEYHFESDSTYSTLSLIPGPATRLKVDIAGWQVTEKGAREITRTSIAMS